MALYTPPENVAVYAWGGASRRLPTGGFAKGIPENESTPPEAVPTTTPFEIVAVGVVESARSSRGAARLALAKARQRMDLSIADWKRAELGDGDRLENQLTGDGAAHIRPVTSTSTKYAYGLGDAKGGVESCLRAFCFSVYRGRRSFHFPRKGSAGSRQRALRA